MAEPTRVEGLAGLAVGALAVGTLALVWMSLFSTTTAGILGDLAIYREAILHAAAGGALYDYIYEHPTVHGLGFTYPPFAALVMTPFTWLPKIVADWIWTAGTLLLAIGLCLLLVLRAPRDGPTWVGPSPNWARLTWLSSAAVMLVTLSYPMTHNLAVGQISIGIIALSLVDAGGLLPRRFQGSLVGLAAAIKLTPLIFLPYYLVTRQWRQAGLALGVFAGATAVGFAVYPQESLIYWSTKVFDTSRVGRLDSPINLSIMGTLSRWQVGGSAQRWLWVALCLLVAAVALYRSRRQFLRGDLVSAALVVGCLGTAVSPISWPHHVTWAVLAGIWLLLYRNWRAAVLGATVLAVFLVTPNIGDVVDPALVVRIGRDLSLAVVLAICLSGLPSGPTRSGTPARTAVPGTPRSGPVPPAA